MTLGEKIRFLRKEKHYSILKLRELTGLSKSTISELENDKSSPTTATLEKIANALGVKIEDLFRDKPITEKKLKEWDKNADQLKEEVTLYETGEFRTPEAAIQFILKQPAIMGFGGFDINKMSDSEIIEFANELLNQLKLLSYKYKK